MTIKANLKYQIDLAWLSLKRQHFKNNLKIVTEKFIGEGNYCSVARYTVDVASAFSTRYSAFSSKTAKLIQKNR